MVFAMVQIMMAENADVQDVSIPTSGRVLVVDDEPDYLAHMRYLLHRHHYDVHCVDTGADALDLIQNEPFDLVILDVQMPAMDGLEVLKSIRERFAPVDLPVILYTASNVPNAKLKGFRLGANDYIDKFEPAELLLARIETFIHSKQLEDERHRTLEQLRGLERLQASLVHIASHDLKDELNLIQMATDMLLYTHRDDATRQHVGTIVEAVSSSESLINTFMDVNRLRDGRLELYPVCILLDVVLYQVVSKYAAAAERKAQQLKVEIGAIHALADEARLMQVIGNLISNAIKYSPKGSEIIIRTDLIGDHVRIGVQDAGPGIQPDERASLFTLFSQISTRPTANEKSTGLGLWIVKHLIERMNGRVGADFPETGGSCFWVELPHSNAPDY